MEKERFRETESRLAQTQKEINTKEQNLARSKDELARAQTKITQEGDRVSTITCTGCVNVIPHCCNYIYFIDIKSVFGNVKFYFSCHKPSVEMYPTCRLHFFTLSSLVTKM